MPYVYPNKFNMYYTSTGSGHPVLLIPGVGYGAWFWERVSARLVDSYHVIAPDPRGAGQSDKPAGPYTLNMLVADYAGLLDALKVRGAFVIGHGLGAYLAQSMALERPELVAKLVLCAGTFGGPNALPATEEAVQIMSDREGEPIDVIRRNVAVTVGPGFPEAQPDLFQELIEYRLSGAVPPHCYQAQARANAATALDANSLEERLNEIAVPTLILFGEADSITPPANAELMAARLPDARVTILPGGGHLFPLEMPQETLDAITPFLGGMRYGV